MDNSSAGRIDQDDIVIVAEITIGPHRWNFRHQRLRNFDQLNLARHCHSDRDTLFELDGPGGCQTLPDDSPLLRRKCDSTCIPRRRRRAGLSVFSIM